MFYNLNPTYLIFAIPGLIIALFAQILIKVRYNKYSKLSSRSNYTGLDVAKLIREREGYPVDIAVEQGKLQDNFDPTRDIVNISSDNVESDSVANIAVVAHEFGHVDQKFSSSLLFQVRTYMVPVVNIGSNLGYILFFIGLLLNALGLAQLGLFLFASTTVFAFITLPIEFNASKRGMKFIEKYNLIDSSRRDEARKILNAAALTYIAGFITSLGSLLYYASLLSGRKKN
jgi:Zn-dependent membrane protease YugP